MSRTALSAAAMVLLIFTGLPNSRADPAHGLVADAALDLVGQTRVGQSGVEQAGVGQSGVEQSGVEQAGVGQAGVEQAGVGQAGSDPVGPGDAEPGTRNGPAARMGTLAGYALFAGERILGIGGYVAAGVRLGRVFVEAEYGHVALYERTYRHRERVSVGTFDRLGVTGRLDIFELGRDVVGANSKLVFWLEGGLGRQRGRWTTGDRFVRTDRIAGLGLLLDHRFKKPLGFPSRVGWHFGWRFTDTHDPEPEYLARMVCKTIACPAEPADRDIGLLVSSGMHFSW